MYHCRCRALTELGDPIYFSARDIPVKVFQNSFTLAARPGTPLLQVATLCRAMDHLPLAEGDTVLIEGKKYAVTYHRGFTFKSESGVIIPAHAVSSYELLCVDAGVKSKLQFKYRDHVFQLPSFFGCVDGKAVLSTSLELVEPDQIQVSAGFTYNKEKVFYGDTINGGEVIMWRGRPCIRKEGAYVEVPTGNLLGGVGD